MSIPKTGFIDQPQQLKDSEFEVIPYEDVLETYNVLEGKVRAVKVLDKGYVKLLNVNPLMCPIGRGPETEIVKSARTSTTGDLQEKWRDISLLDTLTREYHTSPFEQVSFSFLIHCPMFVCNQLVRHRTGKFNIFSGRYSKMTDEFYIPDRPRTQNPHNKQVTDFNELSKDALEHFNKCFAMCSEIYTEYEKMLENGVGKEMARMILPQNIYTTVNVTFDLHNLLHFFRLRCEWDCQWETRQFANAMYDLVNQIIPDVLRIYENYQRDSLTLSAQELQALKEGHNEIYTPSGKVSATKTRIFKNKLTKLEKIKQE